MPTNSRSVSPALSKPADNRPLHRQPLPRSEHYRPFPASPDLALRQNPPFPKTAHRRIPPSPNRALPRFQSTPNAKWGTFEEMGWFLSESGPIVAAWSGRLRPDRVDGGCIVTAGWKGLSAWMRPALGSLDVRIDGSDFSGRVWRIDAGVWRPGSDRSRQRCWPTP